MAFAIGLTVGTSVRLLPEEIDLINAAALGAGIGAAIGAGLAILTMRNPGEDAARGAAFGMVATILAVAVFALLNWLQ